MERELQESPGRCETQLHACRTGLLRCTERTLQAYEATDGYCQERQSHDLETHRLKLLVVALIYIFSQNQGQCQMGGVSKRDDQQLFNLIVLDDEFQ